MDEAQTPNQLNDAERDRIRRTLQRYMEEARIGTPTLQVQIIDADTPRHREIPLSTLQRFLRGSHHTSEHHVMLCYDFVKELPYYGQGKDIALFGAAASAFFTQARDAAEDVHEILRRYEVIMSPREYEQGDNPLRILEGKIATLSLAHDGDNPWLEAREEASPFDNEARYKLEGIALYKAPYLHIFLRDLLTRFPRLYVVQKHVLTDEQSESEIFAGQGQHGAPWQKTMPKSVARFFDVKFLPESEQGEAP